MHKLNATRSNLLALKAKIALARRGCQVLKDKRNALIRELMRIVPEALQDSNALEKAMSGACDGLFRMLALDGEDAAASAALAAQGEIFLNMETSNIMGLQVPQIQTTRVQRSPLSRGYSLFGLSTRIHRVSSDFENLVQHIQLLAGVEIQVRRLGQEITRTNRRVNGLEQILIPALNRERHRLQQVLNERERQDLFYRRRSKQLLETRGRGI